MKSAPDVSLNMNDVPKADSLRRLWLSSDIFKVHARNEGTLVLLPYHCPPGKQALYTRTARRMYDAALQLPCLSCSEVQSRARAKKGKLATRAPAAAPRRTSPPISGCLNVKMRGARRTNITRGLPVTYHIVRFFVRPRQSLNIYNAPRARAFPDLSHLDVKREVRLTAIKCEEYI